MVEYGREEKSGGDNQERDYVLSEIAEIERIYKYRGPVLHLPDKDSVGRACVVDVNGKGIMISAMGKEPNGMRYFAKGLKSFIRRPQCRFTQAGGLIVARTTSRDEVLDLEKQLAGGSVHRLDARYMGFYVANSGVLVPAYGKPQSDAKCVNLIKMVLDYQ